MPQPKAQTPSSMQGHKSVFRVPNYRSQTLQGFTDDPSDRVYHSRRSHRKSRGGCANCKQRRVKCDESKPHCVRCQKHGVDCNYTATAPPVRSQPTKAMIRNNPGKGSGLVSLDIMSISMSRLLLSDNLEELLGSSFSTSAAQAPQAGSPSMERVMEALHHFNQVTVGTGFSKTATGVMMGKMTRLAFETPFLMHAIIGLATTHLCTVLPENSSFRVNEAFHWRQSIVQYSQELSASVNEQNMDKLYSTCIVLTVYAFYLEEFSPRSSFVFSSDQTTLNWLLLQGGLRYLLERTQPWLSQSMWWATFMESHDCDVNLEDHRPGRTDLDPEFADVCGITEICTTKSNPCLWPLRMLTNLLPLERGPESRQQYFMFMGRLESPYLDRLLQKDTGALLILAWWLALMCKIDEWWAETRVRSECTAICMRLEDSQDPRVLRLLEFPASCCGYLLRHVQEREWAALEAPCDLVPV
ncbi:hypothetical protein N7492_009211 [Penicillium capsulatum]|uniref:Zn(2)-C6 fungal-type domain-containing protein n=1 Tax=Penicillium capsulatum TaxID=69766 RepID=A0A9W9HTJ4_9EURO|nr:hypothetical protein N7492_009211 [Penicillium capsulatum]KAJ6106607.1 hypothetical protein N7512_010124 [Penicillium capsulatum]